MTSITRPRAGPGGERYAPDRCGRDGRAASLWRRISMVAQPLRLEAHRRNRRLARAVHAVQARPLSRARPDPRSVHQRRAGDAHRTQRRHVHRAVHATDGPALGPGGALLQPLLRVCAFLDDLDRAYRGVRSPPSGVPMAAHSTRIGDGDCPVDPRRIPARAATHVRRARLCRHARALRAGDLQQSVGRGQRQPVRGNAIAALRVRRDHRTSHHRLVDVALAMARCAPSGTDAHRHRRHGKPLLARRCGWRSNRRSGRDSRPGVAF